MRPPSYFVLDIETTPGMNLPEECLPKFDELDVSIGNLKDPFKIREKIEAARIKFEQDLSKKMSTDPDLCHVCACVIYNSDTRNFSSAFAKDRDEEYELLDRAWAWIRECLREKIILVSFNGLSFDLPVLFRRAMIQDVSVAPSLIEALTARYSNKVHLDLMQSLAVRNPFSGKLEARSLDHYLKRFCLGAKMEGWDGSKVYPAFLESKFDEILQYCKSDVLNTAALFERVYPWLFVPWREEEINPIQKRKITWAL